MTPGRKTAVSGQRSAVTWLRADDPPVGARGSGLAARGRSRGFTLIEILIVVSIIGILITLAQPSFTRAVTAAKEATLKENLFILRDVIDQYYADNTKYPGTLAELAEKGYIRRVPKDPITDSADTWVLVQATDDQGQAMGVFDVKSGSDRTASDGSKYSDW
jgi:general secretion pathway protein G